MFPVVPILRVCLSAALTVMIIVVALDPTDRIAHLKTPVFVAVISLWVGIKLLSGFTIRNQPLLVLALTVSLLIPSVALTSGLLQENISDPYQSMEMVKAFLFFFMIILVHDQRIRLGDRLARWSLLIAIAASSVYIVFLLSPELAGDLYDYTLRTGTIMIDTSRQIGIGMYYYKTSALLLFPLAFYLGRLELPRRKVLSVAGAVVAAFGILLSGSRANIFAGGAVVLFYAIRNVRRRFGLIFAGAVVVAVLLPSVAYVAGNWFSGAGNEGSDQIKYLHFVSYVERFSDHPATLLVGDGIGSEFRSQAELLYGNGAKLNSELTYFETVRTLGLPLALVMIAVIVSPLFLLWRNRRPEASSYPLVPYAAYLVVAGTNPLLFSSTGMIAIICVFSEAFDSKPAPCPIQSLAAQGVA